MIHAIYYFSGRKIRVFLCSDYMVVTKLYGHSGPAGELLHYQIRCIAFVETLCNTITGDVQRFSSEFYLVQFDLRKDIRCHV